MREKARRSNDTLHNTLLLHSEDDGIECRKSKAIETVSTYRKFSNPPDNFYRVSIKHDEIGEVIDHNIVILREKNAALAKEIFSHYLSKGIADKEMQIEDMKKRLEIVERWETE